MERKQTNQSPTVAKIDIIIPVFNALDQVRECISSILAHRDEHVHLIVVDDGSYNYVGRWITQRLDGLDNVTLVTKPVNEGYLAAVNNGMELSRGDIVICQNSDTVVFAGFFDRLRAVFASNSEIGIVNPLSVWANWTRISFPPGYNMASLSERIWQEGGLEVVDIGNASGFSFAIRREVVTGVGYFDPIYGPGYWEEADYCMRALKAGWRVVCCKGLFVFHHGWSSFGQEGRNEYMKRNEAIFRKRWGEMYRPYETRFKLNDPLAPEKALISTWDRRIDAGVLSFQSQESKPLSVLYILPSLAHYGGIISVIQIMNRLVLAGVDARMAVVGSAEASVLRYGPCYFSPMGYASLDDIAESCEKVDVVMATHFSTAYPALQIFNQGKAKAIGYFVQDFEPDFFNRGSKEAFLAEETYHLIKNRICKTSWLKRKLDEYGGHTEIIPLGLNTDIFVDYEMPRRHMLVTMARPSSPRRNWPAALKVLKALREFRPDIEIGVYGFGFKNGDLPEGAVDFGLIETASGVARMLNQAMVLLDGSTFQGFGRPGLEAIACGVVPVLTKNGGITSYAKHMHNALLIDPSDNAGMIHAICRLFDDGELYRELRENGKGLSSGFSMRDEGDRTASYLRSLVG